jgi:hypothetical protein
VFAEGQRRAAEAAVARQGAHAEDELRVAREAVALRQSALLNAMHDVMVACYLPHSQ